MNLRPLTLLSIALVALLVPTLAAGTPAEPADDAAEEVSFEDWLAGLSEPGPGHQVLDAIVGTWEGAGKIWDSIDSEPIPIQATVERHWVLGGRYLREAVQVRTPGEELYEALGFIGYNNGAGQYELLTIDNASTSMLLEHGKFNPDTQQLVIRGTSRDPATGYVLYRRIVMDLSQEGKISVVGHLTDEEGREYKFLEGSVSRREK